MKPGQKPFFTFFSSVFAVRIVNTLIRLGSLGAKLLFALYMGRYLGLAEMGTYGLISAYVAVMVTVVGMRFDYIVSRDIVEATPLQVTCKIRDQLIFFALNYTVMGVVLALLLAGPFAHVSTRIALYIFILSILESIAAVTSTNIISLKQPVFSNILFFIRAAAWTAPVMVLGFLKPEYRTADTILLWWIGGVCLSLFITFAAWRNWPWHEAMRVPIDWAWIKSGARRCLIIWLGSIGQALASYVDRFVVEHYLTREFVGIISFYSSFVFSIQSLLYSSVFAFSYPKLITHHLQGDKVQFRKDVWRMTLQAMLFAGLIALAVGVAVPVMGPLFHRPEFARYAFILWMLLFAIWLRSATESLYYVLYARHQDRLISLGSLLALIPAFGGNMLLVPIFGLTGVGYSAILTALFICAWRIYGVMRPYLPITERMAGQEAPMPETETQEENF